MRPLSPELGHSPFEQQFRTQDRRAATRSMSVVERGSPAHDAAIDPPIQRDNLWVRLGRQFPSVGDDGEPKEVFPGRGAQELHQRKVIQKAVAVYRGEPR